jgi:hypothetical protein
MADGRKPIGPQPATRRLRNRRLILSQAVVSQTMLATAGHFADTAIATACILSRDRAIGDL